MTKNMTEFAELLVAEVRDATIRSCDGLVGPNANSRTARRWRAEAARASSAEPPVSIVIPDCVDATISFLLRAIDQGILQLRFCAKDGSTVDLVDEGDGELAGWYMGRDGWRAKYSQERVATDSSDPDVDR